MNNSNEEEIEELEELVLNAFKTMFNELMIKFNDSRKVKFGTPSEQTNITSVLPSLGKSIIQNITTSKIINIYFDFEKIRNLILKTSKKEMFWNNLFAYFAQHEYSHSFLDIRYRFFPDDVKKYAIEHEITTIYKLPKQLLKAYLLHSKTLKTQFNNVNLTNVLDLVLEFFAYYTVRKRIDARFPEEFFYIHKKGLKERLIELNLSKKLKNPEISIKDKCFYLINIAYYSQPYFMYDSDRNTWKIIEKLLNNLNLNAFLKPICSINNKTQKIVENVKDYDEIESNVIDLASYIEALILALV